MALYKPKFCIIIIIIIIIIITYIHTVIMNHNALDSNRISKVSYFHNPIRLFIIIISITVYC